MTLEDTVGDIIRKARQSASISAQAAAQAASLSLDDFAALEETGQASKRPDFATLAHLLGLEGTRLAAIADGWHPGPVPIEQWRELRQIRTQGSGMTVNCYLVWDEVTREAAVFDTGFEARPVLAQMEREHLQLKHVFITHSHHDHVAGLSALREAFPKARLHSSSMHAPPDQRNRPNDFIHLGSLRITNRPTPGHAEDGVSYIIGNWPDDAPSVAVVGDAIFAGSIGGARDLADLAKQKIRDQIFSLPAETLICPGHGPLTTVGLEKANNPFFTPEG